MPVKKRVTKTATRTKKAEKKVEAAKVKVSRGRPAYQVDYDAPLPEVFDRKAFDFDPADGWDDLDRGEILQLLRTKYGKTLTDVIADCFDEDPDMEYDHIISMLKNRCNLDVDRQYIYTSKMRWKKAKEVGRLRAGAAVNPHLLQGELMTSLANLVKKYGMNDVKDTLNSLDAVAALLQ